MCRYVLVHFNVRIFPLLETDIIHIDLSPIFFFSYKNTDVFAAAPVFVGERALAAISVGRRGVGRSFNLNKTKRKMALVTAASRALSFLFKLVLIIVG